MGRVHGIRTVPLYAPAGGEVAHTGEREVTLKLVHMNLTPSYRNLIEYDIAT